MAKLKFLRGSRENYDPVVFKDYVYFALDSHEIIVDGNSYGGVSGEVLLDTIIKVENGTNGEDLIFTHRDGSLTTLSLPLATSESHGLMSKEDKVKLDDVYERLSWLDLNIVDN